MGNCRNIDGGALWKNCSAYDQTNNPGRRDARNPNGYGEGKRRRKEEKDEEKVGDVWDVMLVEPSLTEDLLGLKTWGSSFVLASRLARDLEIPNVDRAKLNIKFEPAISYLNPSRHSENIKTNTNNWACKPSRSALKFLDPVLELGTGTGLVGIIGARLGLNVTVTDLEAILPNLKVNVAQNLLPGDQIHPEVLDWTDAEKDGFWKNTALDLLKLF